MGVKEDSTSAKMADAPDEKDITEAVAKVLSSYKGEKAELIPILQHVQQKLGYLPLVVMKNIAAFVKVPESTVFGVATFYAQFKFKPVGRNIIKVCRGTGCYVKGSPRILEEFEKQLGIKDGGTTKDMEYSLETVACFGSCALAPVVVVNDRVYGRMTPEKARELIKGKK
jgi:NADH-quinone oxidoreductase subunit E